MSYGTSRFESSANNVLGTAERMMSDAAHSTRTCISNHPASSMLTAFATGMGVGLGLALAFGRRSPPPLDVRLRDKIAQLLHDHVPWSHS